MKNICITIGGLVLSAGLCLPAYAADEASPRTGTWSLNNWTPGDAARLTLAYRNPKTRWEWGSDQRLEDLHGLTSAQLHAVHTPVKFTLERDAGVFFFEGAFMVGVGRGEYRFAPNLSYAEKLRELGYDGIDGEDISFMLMAVRDVSLAYAGEVKRSGLRDVAVSDLVRFQDHGVGLAFIRTLTDIGAANLTADDVVRFRDHGIDGGFLRELKTSGAPELSADDIIKLHDHGVRPEYVARIQSAGYGDLTVDQVIKLHDHGVD